MGERTLCTGCLKSVTTCYCRNLIPFRTRTELVILQHPLERRRTVGTARMAHLSITNSRLIAGTSFDDHEEVRGLVEDPKNDCAVLFPGPRSVNVSNQPQRVFEPGQRAVLFVIDGTWDCAKSMLKRSYGLQRLKQICFTPEKGSEYQFRKQPKPYCLSTLEAIDQVLKALEPETEGQVLMRLMRDMVNYQLRFSGKNIHDPHPSP